MTAASWLSTLPEPFHDDPVVVVVQVPDDANLRVGRTEEGVLMGFAEYPDGTKRGLHVLAPVGDYLEHVLTFRSFGHKMVPPEYLGPLSAVPNAVLCRDDVCPLVFFHGAAHLSFLNIKRYFTKESPTWN